MKKWILLVLVSFLISSCAVQNSMYVWTDYKTVLARYTEKPNNANRTELEACLYRIISTSAQQKKRVPPGIYLQYGYLMAVEGKLDMANQYYTLEKNLYPESVELVNEMESKLK